MTEWYDESKCGEVMVSVIVPIFNKEKELARCIDSILNQTFSDLEILLVNDGSKDNSLKICEDYKVKYENIVVIDKENGGVSTARNAGMDQATGEWIMFVDPDDVLFPNAIEELLGHADCGADVVAACPCVVEYIKQDYKELDFDEILKNSGKQSYYDGNTIFCDHECVGLDSFRKAEKKELFLELFNDNYNTKKLRRAAIACPWAKIYKANLLKENNLRFFAELVRMQDGIFNMYVFEKADKVIYIDEALYIYDSGHKVDFQRKYDPNAVRYFDKVLRYRWEFCQKMGWTSGDYLKEFTTSGYVNINAMLKRYFLNENNDKSKADIKKEMKDFFSDEFYRMLLGRKKCGAITRIMYMRIVLLKNELYDALFFMERVIVTVKRLGYKA